MVGNFVDIRMIVLAPGQDMGEFRSFMTNPGGFLDAFGKFFSEKGRGLNQLIFLEGNKDGPPSNEKPGEYPNRAAAGANADFAWIAYWKDQPTNNTTWSTIKQGKDPDWSNFREQWWDAFFKRCHPRILFGAEGAYIPSRPQHGPVYDYLGGVPNLGYVHYGSGAGCLVEGFNVVYDKKWTK